MEKAEQKLRQSSQYVVHVSEGSKKILDSTGVRGGETLEERTKNVRLTKTLPPARFPPSVPANTICTQICL
jgi:hypothetical protein